jgi:hypothetical protein
MARMDENQEDQPKCSSNARLRHDHRLELVNRVLYSTTCQDNALLPVYYTDDTGRLLLLLCCYTKYRRAYITFGTSSRCSLQVDGP